MWCVCWNYGCWFDVWLIMSLVIMWMLCVCVLWMKCCMLVSVL